MERIKLTKRNKFEISWVIMTPIALIVCYPIGHLSVIIFVGYVIGRSIPKIKKLFKMWLNWMNHDD